MKSYGTVLLLLITACTNGERPPEEVESSYALVNTSQECVVEVNLLRDFLSAVNVGRPEVDAKRDFSHGKIRFIGIMGFAPELPGIPKEEEDFYMEKYPYRFVEGMSDFICNEEHLSLSKEVNLYAKNYNIALRSILSSKKNQ